MRRLKLRIDGAFSLYGATKPLWRMGRRCFERLPTGGGGVFEARAW